MSDMENEEYENMEYRKHESWKMRSMINEYGK